MVLAATTSASSSAIGVSLVVAGAGLLHAVWNAVAHRTPDQAIAFTLIGLTGTAVGLVLIPFTPLPAAAAWPFLITSAATHALYSLLLLRSYRLGDFGQTYPIARGTSPLVVGIVAVTVVGQPLPPWHVLGLIAVCAGLASVAFGGAGMLHAHRPGVLAAVTTGLSIAGYTVLDGVGVRHAGTTLGYVAWLFALHAPVLPLLVLARRGVPTTVRQCRQALWPGVGSGLIGVLAYGIVIWAQTRAGLTTVAATREVSILFGAIIGRLAFREPFGRWRIVGAALTVGGIVALTT